jgi:hypothetical protein
VDHLEHLLSGRRPRVTIVPSRCKACEFRFDTRARVLLLVGDADIGGGRVDAAEQLARVGARVGLSLVASASQPRTDFRGGSERREHLVLLRPTRR